MMPTQQEIQEATDRFAALPAEEQKRVLNEQKERRAQSQLNIIKLQQHSDLLRTLVDLDQDQARVYVTKLGENGVGNASEELISEILAYIDVASVSKYDDLNGLLSMLTPSQVAEALKDSADFAAVAVSQSIKEPK